MSGLPVARERDDVLGQHQEVVEVHAPRRARNSHLAAFAVEAASGFLGGPGGRRTRLVTVGRNDDGLGLGWQADGLEA